MIRRVAYTLSCNSLQFWTERLSRRDSQGAGFLGYLGGSLKQIKRG